jgi:hypothetical protein
VGERGGGELLSDACSWARGSVRESASESYVGLCEGENSRAPDHAAHAVRPPETSIRAVVHNRSNMDGDVQVRRRDDCLRPERLTRVFDWSKLAGDVDDCAVHDLGDPVRGPHHRRLGPRADERLRGEVLQAGGPDEFLHTHAHTRAHSTMHARTRTHARAHTHTHTHCTSYQVLHHIRFCKQKSGLQDFSPAHRPRFHRHTCAHTVMLQRGSGRGHRGTSRTNAARAPCKPRARAPPCQVLEPGYEFLKGYSIPSGTDVNVFRRHIDENLPAVDVPEVVGLNQNADLTYRLQQVRESGRGEG